MTTQKAVLTANGDLLLPHPHDCGADVIPPDDPRYAELAAEAITLDVPEDPAADAAFAAEFEARYRARHSAA